MSTDHCAGDSFKTVCSVPYSPSNDYSTYLTQIPKEETDCQKKCCDSLSHILSNLTRNTTILKLFDNNYNYISDIVIFCCQLVRNVEYFRCGFEKSERILTCWHVMNKATHTQMPARPWAVFVCRKIPSPTWARGSIASAAVCDSSVVTLAIEFDCVDAVAVVVNVAFNTLSGDAGIILVVFR